MNKETAIVFAFIAFTGLGIVSYWHDWTIGFAAGTLGACAAIGAAKFAGAQQLKRDLADEGIFDPLISERGDKLVAFDRLGAVVIGKHNRRVTIKPGELLDVSIRINSPAVTKTNRGSQLAGAAIGAAAFGGVGLLVGGLTGKKTTTEIVESVSLEIITSNPACRTVSIHLLPLGVKHKRESAVVQHAIATAHQWLHDLTVRSHHIL